MDDKVLEQIGNVARLPGLVGAAMAMPDAHWGYGFPIGGVAASDPDAGGIISAGGVGFDISCGIRCLRTSLDEGDVLQVARKLSDALFRDIPAGVGEGGLSAHRARARPRARRGRALGRGRGLRRGGGPRVHRGSRVREGRGPVVRLAAREVARSVGEMGTLGSGNHYLEVQCVERVHDPTAAEAFGIAEGQVVVSIHCGSRGLGHQIGTDFLVSLAQGGLAPGHRRCRTASSPARRSARPEGEEYLGAMNAATNCALANRQILAHLTRGVFRHFFRDARVETLFDVSHNTCKLGDHEVDGRERLLYVHRKGATRAFGPGHPSLPARYRAVGQPVVIGGSMGTGSYILAGDGHERGARLQFREPRRRALDEPNRGAQALARARARRRAGRTRHHHPHALDARRGRAARSAAAGRWCWRCRAAPCRWAA